MKVAWVGVAYKLLRVLFHEILSKGVCFIWDLSVKLLFSREEMNLGS